MQENTEEMSKKEPEIYGYVRVSTVDQNEDRQLDAMHRIGIDDKHIFMEKKSGPLHHEYRPARTEL